MWEYDTLEILQDFAREQMSKRTIQMLMDHLELSMYSCPDRLRSASNLAMIYGDSDYGFTSDELMWLYCADNVALCKGEGSNLLFINLNVDPEEYYITSAAIIKIYNIVFPSNNQYIFKVGTALAFGCKRTFEDHEKNNFCVTQLFPIEHLEECVYFLEEALLSDEDDLPYIVMQYSPQEMRPGKNEVQQNEASSDYLCFLHEMNSIYGVDVSKEYVRYLESFARLKDCQITYSDVCTILHLIGEDTAISTYDILDDALYQEGLALGSDASLDNPTNDDENRPLEFSQDVLMDAEQLLKEMLKQDKQQNNRKK